MSPHVCLAMLMGQGYATVERWVKDSARVARYEVDSTGPARVDLEGFECRWQPVRLLRRGAGAER